MDELLAGLFGRHVPVGIESRRSRAADLGDFVLFVVAVRLSYAISRHRIPVSERVKVPRLRTARKAVAFVESCVDTIPLREAVAIAVYEPFFQF